MYSTKKKKLRARKVNPKLLYSENNVWSDRNAIWEQFQVSKPRLPNEEDIVRWVDNHSNHPKNFGCFTGNQNDHVIKSLCNLVDSFSHSGYFPEVLTIYGAPGSGKTSIVRIFLQMMISAQGFTTIQGNKWKMFVSAKTYGKDLNKMWTRIAKWTEPPVDRFISCKFRLLVIDDYDDLPPSSQQTLKKIIESQESKLRYLFISNDPKKNMINFVFQKSTNVKTKLMSEKDTLSVVLSILHRNNIGFNRHGVHEVFKMESRLNVSAILDQLQEVFTKTQFCSLENVHKVAGIPIEPPAVTQTQIIEPLERCKLCTLYPPCQHISEKSLIELSIERRKELPRYKKGSMTCPEFARYGKCSMFNRNGHCSLDHPKNLHVVKFPPIRCKKCTIVWPCGHCDYTHVRIKLQQLIDEIQARVVRLRQIHVPDPPLSMIRHLEFVLGWQVQCARFERLYYTALNMQHLQELQDWMDNSYCTIEKEYEQKEEQLLDLWGDMVTSPILLDPTEAAAMMESEESSLNNSVDQSLAS